MLLQRCGGPRRASRVCGGRSEWWPAAATATATLSSPVQTTGCSASPLVTKNPQFDLLLTASNRCCRSSGRIEDGGAFRERRVGPGGQHHGDHRGEPAEAEVRPVRRRRRLLHLRAGQEPIRRRRCEQEQEVGPPRPGRRQIRRRAAVAEQEDLVGRAGRGDAGVGLLRVAGLPPAHHRLLRARARHGRPVRLVHVRLQRAAGAAARGAVRQRRRGRRRPGEQGAGVHPGRVLRTEPQAVGHCDRRVLRGRSRRQLLQLADGHLHRVRERAHAAGAVREVPGPGGRLPVQHAGRGAEPVPEAGHKEHPQGRRQQVQEDRLVPSIIHSLPASSAEAACCLLCT